MAKPKMPDPHQQGWFAILDLTKDKHDRMVLWLLRRIRRRQRISTRDLAAELHIRTEDACAFLGSPWRLWAEAVIEAGIALPDLQLSFPQPDSPLASAIREAVGKRLETTANDCLC